jgi:hypothetical protein
MRRRWLTEAKSPSTVKRVCGGESSLGTGTLEMVKSPADQLLLCCFTLMVVGLEAMYSVRRAMGCLRWLREVMVSEVGVKRVVYTDAKGKCRLSLYKLNLSTLSQIS